MKCQSKALSGSTVPTTTSTCSRGHVRLLGGVLMTAPLFVYAFLRFRPARADGGWIVEGHFGNCGPVLGFRRVWRTKVLASRRSKRINATWLAKRLDKVLIADQSNAEVAK